MEPEKSFVSSANTSSLGLNYSWEANYLVYPGGLTAQFRKHCLSQRGKCTKVIM